MKFSPVHTACGNCIFSLYDDKESKAQTGCVFNRIELYEDAGAEVIPVYDDEEREFFVINNRSCAFKRTKDWGDQHQYSEWEDIVREETKIPHQVILFYLDDANISNVEYTLKMLAAAHTIPTVITIVTKDKDVIELAKLIQKFPLQIRIKHILIDELHRRQMIDLVIDETKNMYRFLYYIIYDAEQFLAEDLSKDLYNEVHINMKQLIVARPVFENTMHGGIYNAQFHLKHAGNSFGITLEDKLLKFEDKSIENKIIRSRELDEYQENI